MGNVNEILGDIDLLKDEHKRICIMMSKSNDKDERRYLRYELEHLEAQIDYLKNKLSR